ncbi:MAG: FHA domain-containing protein [Clostridia bacterium]|nr:FHA domain-containing protein [Clostridia bacterium]
MDALLMGGLFANLGVLLVVFYILVGITAAAALYYVYCLPQERIAKKLGLQGWLAFIPVARNIQRMKMAEMPMWMLLFVGSSLTPVLGFSVIGLVTVLLAQLNGPFAAVMCILLSLGYLVMFYLTTYRYYSRIVTKFGFSSAMAFVLLILPVINQTVLYFIALDNRYQVKKGGEAESSAFTQVVQRENQPAKISSAAAGLEGVSGMYTGAKFNMASGEEFVIGRDGALSNIIISANSEKVSRRHCSVKYNATMGCYEVTDYSMNGTFYGNTRLVKDQVTRVQRGTVLVIGDKLNQFKLL